MRKVEGSGRKRGTPNKKTVVLSALFESKGIDIPLKLLELIPQLTPEKQADILLNLLPYLYPKFRATENSQLDDELSLEENKNNVDIDISDMTDEEDIKLLEVALKAKKMRLAN